MSTASNTATEFGSGYLEISEKGFGFLRTAQNHFHPKPTDIFVTPDTIKRNFLREGCLVAGPTQPPHRGNSPQLKTVDTGQRHAVRGLHQGGALREPHHH